MVFYAYTNNTGSNVDLELVVSVSTATTGTAASDVEVAVVIDDCVAPTFFQNMTEECNALGETINIDVNHGTMPTYRLGEELYNQRFGQMGMTCHHCHVQYQGLMLRGQKLTQGQTNGFPVYRFGSSRITSLHRRFNECFVQLRAEPFEVGSEEYRALEYYMGVMSNGLQVETPGVRF